MSDRIGYSDDSIEQWTHIRRVSREYPSLRFIHAAIVLEFSLVGAMACKKKKKKIATESSLEITWLSSADLYLLPEWKG